MSMKTTPIPVNQFEGDGLRIGDDCSPDGGGYPQKEFGGLGVLVIATCI